MQYKLVENNSNHKYLCDDEGHSASGKKYVVFNFGKEVAQFDTIEEVANFCRNTSRMTDFEYTEDWNGYSLSDFQYLVIGEQRRNTSDGGMRDILNNCELFCEKHVAFTKMDVARTR